MCGNNNNNNNNNTVYSTKILNSLYNAPVRNYSADHEPAGLLANQTRLIRFLPKVLA